MHARPHTGRVSRYPDTAEDVERSFRKEAATHILKARKSPFVGGELPNAKGRRSSGVVVGGGGQTRRGLGRNQGGVGGRRKDSNQSQQIDREMRAGLLRTSQLHACSVPLR